MKETWEKVLEYASMPVHGTLSRKLRKGVSLQINEGKVYTQQAVLFLDDTFIRISEEAGKEKINTYIDWTGITSIRTMSEKEE